MCQGAFCFIRQATLVGECNGDLDEVPELPLVLDGSVEEDGKQRADLVCRLNASDVGLSLRKGLDPADLGLLPFSGDRAASGRKGFENALSP